MPIWRIDSPKEAVLNVIACPPLRTFRMNSPQWPESIVDVRQIHTLQKTNIVTCIIAVPNTDRSADREERTISAIRTQSPEKVTPPVIRFIGEQDGSPERDLKARFTELFREKPTVQ